MIAFVTSIRHPLNSNNFKAVEQLFEAMAMSVCNQTIQSFRLVVVCNKVPIIGFSHPNIEYLVVDFPAPSEVYSSNIPFESLVKDRGCKISKGCAYASKYNPSHYFILDADDFIDKDIAKFLSQPHSIGFSFYANKGYILNKKTLMQNLIYGMVRYCGSTIAVSKRFLDVAIDYSVVNNAVDQKFLVSYLETQGMLWFFGEHSDCFRILSTTNRFKEIPFPATCWLVGNGENHSGTSSAGGKILKSRVIQRFGIRKVEKVTPHKNKLLALYLGIKSSLGTFRSYFSWRKSLKTGRFYY